MADVQAEVLQAEGVKHGRRRHGGDAGGEDSAAPKQRAGAAAAGWGDDAAGGGGGGSGSAAAPPVEEPAVTVVRDGDEAAEAAERLATTVADAPRNTGRRLATLKELEGEGGGGGGAGSLNVAASRAEGIDLSLLTSSLYPVEALQEVDAVVDWEAQLQRITQEMRQESDKREGEGEAGSEDAQGSPARRR
jgi:hypothetical protein